MVNLYFSFVTIAILFMALVTKDTAPLFATFCVFIAGIAFGEVIGNMFDEEDEGR